MQDCFKNFDALSVRETQGAQIIKKLCGREAEVVCDPTLLLPAEAYTKIERRPALSCLPPRYVAVYTVGGHPLAKDAACRMGARLGIPVVQLLGGATCALVLALGESQICDCVGTSGMVVVYAPCRLCSDKLIPRRNLLFAFPPPVHGVVEQSSRRCPVVDFVGSGRAEEACCLPSR